MNYKLPYIPERDEKPRKKGLTMVMDKGLSLQEAVNLCDSSGHLIDYIKLGFGTSLVSKKVQEKINVYKEHKSEFILAVHYSNLSSSAKCMMNTGIM